MSKANKFSKRKYLLVSSLFLGLFMLNFPTSVNAQEVPEESLSVKDTPQSTDTLLVPQVSDTFEKKSVQADTLLIERVVPNFSFGVGEKLKFKVRWGPIKAGNATMEIPEIVEYNGKKCYRIVSIAESSKFFSTFFKVRDRVESITDMEGLYSLHFEKHIREGKFLADKTVDFDQINHLALAGKDTIPVPPFVQDVLSALYYVRTQPLEVGKSIFVDNHTDKKNYPLEVKVLKKERVEVDAGTFDCLVVQPILQAAGVFEQKGTLTVWLTDDQKKMPVLMKSKVAIGSITTELTDYNPGKIGE
ncbi:MAG TPA: DUF3108 domain-containing protein [Terriglobales bacterium]|nr:DUF3108 domain-containing protein [Terriglobales bacterium]